MAALFNNITVLHKQDDVRIPDGGEPVGDDKAGSPAHKRLHSLADFYLSSGVHAGSRLVENNNRRVAKEHPGDGQKLTLSG